MTIDADGRLMDAIPDKCKNYMPDKTKVSNSNSVRLGSIFPCKKHIQGDKSPTDCLWCKNRTDENEVYLNIETENELYPSEEG